MHPCTGAFFTEILISDSEITFPGLFLFWIYRTAAEKMSLQLRLVWSLGYRAPRIFSRRKIPFLFSFFEIFNCGSKPFSATIWIQFFTETLLEWNYNYTNCFKWIIPWEISRKKLGKKKQFFFLNST